MPVNGRVLFFVYQRTVFVDAYRTAAQLKAKTKYEPVFLVAAGTSNLVAEDIDRCKRDGIACFTEEDFVVAAPPPPQEQGWRLSVDAFRRRCFDFAKYRTLWLAMRCWKLVTIVVPRETILSVSRIMAKRLASRAVKRAGQLPYLIERISGISSEINRLRGVEARYRDTLQHLKPDILCLSEDMPGPITGPLIKVARQLKIPTVIIPFTIPNVREAIEARYADTWQDTWLTDYLTDHLALNMYPRWSLTYKDRELLRVRGRLAIVYERVGIAPPNPWVSNSGFADRIAVESEQMLAIYRNLGFPEHQLALTGNATDDLLSEALRESASRKYALYTQLGLRADLPMMLSSLVPDQIAGGVPFCEFERYDVLLWSWVEALAKWQHRYNIVLRVNPRSRWQDFLYLERLGAKVAPDDTISLMPFAEIYVASISSTLRWAAACGIPSINYDVYRYRYGDYLGAPGIVHVEKKEEFAAAIDRLAGDDVYRRELRQRQLAQAKSWGCLDGRSTERVVALFEELRSLKGGADAGPSMVSDHSEPSPGARTQILK